MIPTIFSFLFCILAFLVMYGLLNKVKIFDKSINIVIAFIVAFYALTAGYLFADVGKMVMIFIGLVILLMFFGHVVNHVIKKSRE